MAKAALTTAGTARKPRVKRERATVIPSFQGADGKILMEEITKKNDKGELKTKIRPVKFGPKDFPASTDARKAFCRYQQLLWAHREANAGSVGTDPLSKKERQVARYLAKLAEVNAEIAKMKAAAAAK